jgi:uncharacterized protein
MILVADCSALIALASCDGLHLLDALFGTVIVPEAVKCKVDPMVKTKVAGI